MARGYVVLDSTWAHRLGVRRSSGGMYRIARWELIERLKQLQSGSVEPQVDSMERIVSLPDMGRGRGLPEKKPALDDVVTIESHSHFVEFCQTEAFLVDCVSDFLAAGVITRGASIVIAAQAHLNAFDCALQGVEIDISEEQRAGRFTALDASEALTSFMVDGIPHPTRFATSIGQLVSQAVYTGREVRIYEEMVAILWNEGNVAAAIALEDLWNDLATRYQFSLFCAYLIHDVDTAANTPGYRTICRQHSKTIREG